MDVYKTVKKAISYIESRLEQCVTVTDVSKETNYSAKQLNRIFASMTGLSVTKYIIKRKLAIGAKLISKGGYPINYISDTLNIDPSNFSKLFKAEFGVLPKDLKKNFNELDGIDPFDVEHYMEIARQIELGLESLKARNVLNYKMINNGQTVIVKDLNYEWIFHFLITKPSIPIPVNMLMHMEKIAKDESDFEDLLISVLTSAYFELLKLESNLETMKWNYILENELSNEEQEELEVYYGDIKFLYDLKQCAYDEENRLLWFNVKDELLQGIFEKIDFNCDSDYLSVVFDKEEFALFAEVGEKTELLYFTKDSDSKLYMNFNAGNFLNLIDKIGRKIMFPVELMDQVKSKKDKAVILALNKEMYESANTGNNSFSINENEFVMRALVIKAYYNLDTSDKIGYHYIYRFSDEMVKLLEAGHEIESEGLTAPVIYEVKQTDTLVKLILLDSHKKWLRLTEVE